MVKWPLAGRIDLRRGVAALALMLGGALGAGMMSGGCAGVNGRAVLAAGYAASLAVQDRNGDGALDRGEVETLVEAAFPDSAKRGEGWRVLRAWLVAGYMGQDLDRDGRLTLGELLRGPAQAVQCVDMDGDLTLSEAEIAASVGRCPAGMLPNPEGAQ